ncbi:MAG: hypothetical protein WKF97_10405 [Chitinophagaceae bacterium]
MKKILFGLLVILLAIILSVYILIPASLKVSNVIIVNCTINGTNRYLLDMAGWYKWWPGEDTKKTSLPDANTSFIYKGFSYRILRPLYNGFEMLAEHDGRKIKSVLHDFALSKDSVAIQWQYTIKTSLNPFTRWQQYRQAESMKINMGDLLVHLQAFLVKRVNVYGIDIQEIFARDTTLIATTQDYEAYPEVIKIYALIGKLKKHVIAEKAIQTNYPMLHVRKRDDGRFEAMVAIPINRPLPENRDMFNKRFVPWKTLVAETKGGVHTVGQAYKKMALFVEDYQRIPMAIPFELLITDRSIEPDTLKWVSVICQPVS